MRKLRQILFLHLLLLCYIIGKNKKGDLLIMKFIFPCKAYEERAKAFIQEFHGYHSDINSSGAADSYLEKSTYDEWLEKVAADIDLANVPNNLENELYSKFFHETIQRYWIG